MPPQCRGDACAQCLEIAAHDAGGAYGVSHFMCCVPRLHAAAFKRTHERYGGCVSSSRACECAGLPQIRLRRTDGCTHTKLMSRTFVSSVTCTIIAIAACCQPHVRPTMCAMLLRGQHRACMCAPALSTFLRAAHGV